MKVITIDREFGACGHTIGREVAKRLGIEFYDRDIIAKAAAAGGLDPAHVEAEEETISKTHAFISAISPNSYDAKDAIFAHERAVVVELAAQGPCVILGRCANAILREESVQVLSVFLFADPELRMASVGKILGTDDAPAILRAIRKKDTARKAYYHAYTEGEWGNVHECTMSLDTGALGYETCVQIICDAAQAS